MGSANNHKENVMKQIIEVLIVMSLFGSVAFASENQMSEEAQFEVCDYADLETCD